MSGKLEINDEWDKGWMLFERSPVELAAGVLVWMSLDLHGSAADLTGFGASAVYMLLYETRLGFAILNIVCVRLWGGGAYVLAKHLPMETECWPGVRGSSLVSFSMAAI